MRYPCAQGCAVVLCLTCVSGCATTDRRAGLRLRVQRATERRIAAAVEEARAALRDGRPAEAERVLRHVKGESRVTTEMMVLLAEALLVQDATRVFDQEFTPVGRAAVFAASERVRAECARILARAEPLDQLIVLDTLIRAIRGIESRQRAEALRPFIGPLRQVIAEGDRALAVIALNAAALIGTPEGGELLAEVASGGDPVLSRVARGYLQFEDERGRVRRAP